jgi:hypothetical protein
MIPKKTALYRKDTIDSPSSRTFKFQPCPSNPRSLGQSPHHMWNYLITWFRLWLLQVHLTPASCFFQPLHRISRDGASTQEMWPDNIDQSYISVSANWTNLSSLIPYPNPQRKTAAKKITKPLTLIKLNPSSPMTLNMLINNPLTPLPQIPIQIPNRLPRSRHTTQTLNRNHAIRLSFPYPLLTQILHAHRTNHIHIVHCKIRELAIYLLSVLGADQRRINAQKM